MNKSQERIIQGIKPVSFKKILVHTGGEFKEFEVTQKEGEYPEILITHNVVAVELTVFQLAEIYRELTAAGVFSIDDSKHLIIKARKLVPQNTDEN